MRAVGELRMNFFFFLTFFILVINAVETSKKKKERERERDKSPKTTKLIKLQVKRTTYGISYT